MLAKFSTKASLLAQQRSWLNLPVSLSLGPGSISNEDQRMGAKRVELLSKVLEYGEKHRAHSQCDERH